MKILLTGAAGFIGSNFVRMVATGELEGISGVMALDKLTYAGVKENLKPAEIFPGYQFTQGDICNPVQVHQLISEVDAVVNFAAESHVDRSISGAADFVQTNIVGVQVLLDAIKASRRQIRFLQVSTDEVYGTIEKGSWNEEWPLSPNSPYSASKASGELLARSYNKTHDMDVVITRCSNNYGTHHFPEKLIPLFITNLIEGKKVPLYGTGENVRDWLHVEDAARLLLTAASHASGSCPIVNGGSGQGTSVREILSMVFQEFALQHTPRFSGEARIGDPPGYQADTQMAASWGWEPEIPLTVGIKGYVDWFKKR